MSKRGRDEDGAAGQRRPRVDLFEHVDRVDGPVDASAPNYDSWNRVFPGHAEFELDPVQAAIAAKQRRTQDQQDQTGPLGALLSGYGEDEDEVENGAPEDEIPPSPWTKLTDAKTGHCYFWNKDTGAVVWTLAETLINKVTPDDDVIPPGNDTEIKELASEVDKQPVVAEKNRSRDGLENESLGEALRRSIADDGAVSAHDFTRRILKLNETFHSGLVVYFKRLVETQLRECTSQDSATRSAKLDELFCVMERKVNDAVAAAKSGETEIETETETETGKESEINPPIFTRNTNPPPLPPDDEIPPPPPPPPPGVIVKPPAISKPIAGGRVFSLEEEVKTGYVRAGNKKQKSSVTKIDKKNTTFISKPPTQSEVERWQLARTEALADSGDDVVKNSNSAPAAGDWRQRAAAAKARRQVEARERETR
jgi:hypothetical protein|tara:strand:- start:4039 stop:5313 length:1275 start_codon:yes stop_codon:yes gene_type:complete